MYNKTTLRLFIQCNTWRYIYGGIFVHPTCKINYVIMQEKYVNMQLIYEIVHLKKTRSIKQNKKWFCKWILCWLYSRLYDYIIKSLLQSKLMILCTNDNNPISVITNILPSLIVDLFVTTSCNDTHPSFLNMDYTRTWWASLIL